MVGIPRLTDTGTVEAIWIKRAKRGPMDPVREALLIEGKGIDGNADRSRFRQVTLLSREAWDKCMDEIGASLDPSARRANVLIKGMELAHTRGGVVRIGQSELLVRGEATPCERMEEAHAGLRAAMKPEWRGGVFAQVTVGGIIRVGDTVTLEDPQ